MSRGEVLGVSIFLLIAAVQRGLDYLAFPDQETVGLSSIERSFSLLWWGVIFVGLAVVGAVGIYTRRWELLSLAHFVLGGVYVVFAVGYGIDADISDGGWRTSGDWASAFFGANIIMSSVATNAWRRKRAIE